MTTGNINKHSLRIDLNGDMSFVDWHDTAWGLSSVCIPEVGPQELVMGPLPKGVRHRVYYRHEVSGPVKLIIYTEEYVL